MVRIKKGKLTLTVPAGAVRKYTLAGWELADGSKSDENAVAPTNTSTNENGDVNNDYSEPEGEPSEEEDDEDLEYVDPEELAQKPLEELDQDELTILAEFKGLDVSELTTVKKLRAALRALE